MGWRPHEVYRVTVDEFAACWDGWSAIHCAPVENDEPISRDEIDALLEIADRY